MKNVVLVGGNVAQSQATTAASHLSAQLDEHSQGVEPNESVWLKSTTMFGSER